MDRKAELVNTLVQLATRFDKMGLHSLASQVDEVLKAEVSNIDAILQMYEKLHVIANDDAKVRRAIIAAIRSNTRPDTPACPFGLEIPKACNYAGDSVSDMSTRKVEHAHNRRIYNKDRGHSQCPYALQVLTSNDAVHCSYGTINAGQEHWEQFSSSPYYPKLWQAFNIPDPLAHNSNYYGYNDFSYYSLM